MAELFYDDIHREIVYSSSWTRTYGSIYHSSTVHRTRKIGESVQFKFNGSCIRFLGAEGWDHGTFTVNLDGVETTVDGYCCGPNGGVPQVVQFEADNLSPAEHTITVTNARNGPYGSVLELDAFMVTPNPVMPYKTSTWHVAIVLLLIILVFLLNWARRRLVGLATKVLHVLAPSLSPASAAIPSHTVLPLVRAGTLAGKTDPTYAYHDVDAGPSSSSTAPTQYSGSELNSQAVDDIAHQRMHLPEYPSRVELPLDDRLLDQLAQRVASIVQRDSPPSYSASTS